MLGMQGSPPKCQQGFQFQESVCSIWGFRAGWLVECSVKGFRHLMLPLGDDMAQEAWTRVWNLLLGLEAVA